MLKSTARIGRHPLHPMLVVFPIAFWVAAFLSDVIYWRTGDVDFAEASPWLIGAGLVGAALAAAAGLTDYFGNPAIRRLKDANQHMIGNVVAVLVAAASLVIRLTQGSEAAVLPVGIVLSTVVVAILLFTGWKGGELVYRRGVGVDERVDASPVLPDADVGGVARS